MKSMTDLIRNQLLLTKNFTSGFSLELTRRGQERLGRLMAVGRRSQVTFSDSVLGDCPCSMAEPAEVISPGVIYYLHGGGYTAGNLDYAKGFASVLAAQCGVRVFCLAYRLAPEHPFPAAPEDAYAGYLHLISRGFDPSQIALCGESAGGGLCYALCLLLKERARPLPGAVITVSPWVDLTASGATYEEKKDVDPALCAQRLRYFADCYTYGGDPRSKNLQPIRESSREVDITHKQNPLISPLFGDLSRMPPSLIFVGEDEILLDDARRLHARLREQGSSSQLEIRPGLWHGYLLYGIKECAPDFALLRQFIRAHIPFQKKLRWMKLDNAAKIFPAARRRNWSNVFRLSATLKEPIDREVLQSALDVTVRRFPSIAVRLRRGFFWYYLEEIPHAPQVMEEKPYPLARFSKESVRQCAFRVIVYENRIAAEFFHALTDGNGGLVFLKTLVAEYLEQKYGADIPPGNGILDRLEEPTEEELEDSFQRCAGPVKASRSDTNAYRIRGTRDPAWFKTNTTFLLNSPQVAREAKSRGITVTAYLTAALIQAAQQVQAGRVRNKKKHRPIKVVVPVNLRKLFSSGTLRNFVLYVTPGIDPRLGDYDFEELCAIVHHQMHLQLTKKNMQAMIATNVGSEKPIFLRLAPLFLKNIVMKLVFDAVGEKKSCFSFSNLGRVETPEGFNRHVGRMDFVLGSQASAPYNTSAITFGDTLYLNVIRNIEEPYLERELYAVLRRLGLDMALESNTRGRE